MKWVYVGLCDCDTLVAVTVFIHFALCHSTHFSVLHWRRSKLCFACVSGVCMQVVNVFAHVSGVCACDVLMASVSECVMGHIPVATSESHRML